MEIAHYYVRLCGVGSSAIEWRARRLGDLAADERAPCWAPRWRHEKLRRECEPVRAVSRVQIRVGRVMILRFGLVRVDRSLAPTSKLAAPESRPRTSSENFTSLGDDAYSVRPVVLRPVDERLRGRRRRRRRSPASSHPWAAWRGSTEASPAAPWRREALRARWRAASWQSLA